MTDDKQSGGSDGGSKTPPEKAEKPASLTDLLDEWDAKGEKPPAGNTDVDVDVRKEIAELREYIAADVDKKAKDDLVSELRGELDVDDFVVEGWIAKQAEDDPRLEDVYDGREKNPARWREVVKSLKPTFEEFVKTRLSPASNERGVGAAVRAAKDSRSGAGLDVDDVDYGSLSDSEFAAEKAKVFRAARAGKLT
jgi:hypothetical protein